MALTWFSKKDLQGIATVYDTNITFNTTAMDPLKSAYKVMVGFDDENHQVIVRPISRAEAIRGDIDPDGLLGLTIKNSYARIANKRLIDKISLLGHLDFGQQPRKFATLWDDDQQVLRIKINEEVTK